MSEEEYQQLDLKWVRPNIDDGVVQLKVRDYRAKNKLFSEIRERRREISSARNLYENKSMKEVERLLQSGTLYPIEEGLGGAYLLTDKKKNPRYIIKPNDEDVLCLNNPKGIAAPFNDYLRPLYCSAPTELLCYEVAVLLGIPDVTPEITLAVVESEYFHDMLDDLPDEAAGTLGKPDKRKLCSIQRYISSSVDLRDYIKEEKSQAISLASFETCLLFTLIIGETDGNLGNYRVSSDQVIKIDNGLTFLQFNQDISHGLNKLPQIQTPLSDRGRELIESIPVESIVELMRNRGKRQEDIDAFVNRCQALAEFSRNRSLVLESIAL